MDYEALANEMNEEIIKLRRDLKQVSDYADELFADCNKFMDERDALAEKLKSAQEFLERLSHWDMLNTNWNGEPATADGPYWKEQIELIRKQMEENI